MHSFFRTRQLSGTHFLALLAVALAYARLYFGADVTDEAQYVVLTLFPHLGARYFHNEIVIHQTSYMLPMPLVVLYAALRGSTTGIVLFVRHLYFALALLTAAAQFRWLRKYFRRSLALPLALWPLAFVPNSIPSLCYNTLGSFFFALASSLTWIAVRERRPRLAVLGGVLWAAAAFVYPAFLAAGPLFFAGAWLCTPGAGRRRCLRIGALTALVTLAAAALALLLGAGPAALRESLAVSYAINKVPLLTKLALFGSLLGNYAPPVGSLLALLLLWPAWRKLRPTANPAIFLGAFLLLFVACVRISIPPPSHALLPLLTLFAAWALLGRRANARLRAVLTVFFAPAAVMGILLALTSTTVLYAAALTHLYSAAAALALALAAMPARQTRLLTWSMVGLLLVWSYGYTYRDDAFPHLTERVATGPFAGLYTTPFRAEFLRIIQEDIDLASSQGKTIFFYDDFPAGYLMSPLRPATRNVFMNAVPLSYPIRGYFANYYNDPAHQPDVVFYFRSFPETATIRRRFAASELGGPPDPMENYFTHSGHYRTLLERRFYSVLVRR